MSNKETLQNEVYTPLKELKDKFYNAKTQDEWDNYKKELTVLFDRAKELMTPEFFEKYRQGTIDVIAKMYTFKEKYFNKPKFTPQPKQSYIFREDEGKSFIRLCNALADFFNAKLENI